MSGSCFPHRCHLSSSLVRSLFISHQWTVIEQLSLIDVPCVRVRINSIISWPSASSDQYIRNHTRLYFSQYLIGKLAPLFSLIYHLYGYTINSVWIIVIRLHTLVVHLHMRPATGGAGGHDPQILLEGASNASPPPILEKIMLCILN